jgi:hypothetical protein
MRNNLSYIYALADQLERVKIFRELLETGSSGEELEIYVRCLVHLDTSGKLSTNQTSMKEFNIDKLTTDMEVVKVQLPRVCHSFNLT